MPVNRPRRKSRWGRYNRWRAAHREIDRQRRLATAEEKRAAADALLIAEAQATAKQRVDPPPDDLLTLKLTIEIAGEKRVLRSTFVEGFGWSVSGNTLCEGLRALMAHAPRIAATQAPAGR